MSVNDFIVDNIKQRWAFQTTSRDSVLAYNTVCWWQWYSWVKLQVSWTSVMGCLLMNWNVKALLSKPYSQSSVALGLVLNLSMFDYFIISSSFYMEQSPVMVSSAYFAINCYMFKALSLFHSPMSSTYLHLLHSDTLLLCTVLRWVPFSPPLHWCSVFYCLLDIGILQLLSLL